MLILDKRVNIRYTKVRMTPRRISSSIEVIFFAVNICCSKKSQNIWDNYSDDVQDAPKDCIE